MTRKEAEELKDSMLRYYPCLKEQDTKQSYMGATLMSYEIVDMIEDCIDNALNRAEKHRSNGCKCCEFVDTEEWEMPCAKCRRNSKDYWRARYIDKFEVTE